MNIGHRMRGVELRGVAANTQHQHVHHTDMIAWFLLSTPLDGVATCFSCYAGRHWAIHVCMFHPFRVHDFLLCRSPLGDSCTCVCMRSTRFEMRKVLLASTEANKIFGGCAADRRPLEQNKYPHTIKTPLGLNLHIAFLFFLSCLSMLYSRTLPRSLALLASPTMVESNPLTLVVVCWEVWC